MSFKMSHNSNNDSEHCIDIKPNVSSPTVLHNVSFQCPVGI